MFSMKIALNFKTPAQLFLLPKKIYRIIKKKKLIMLKLNLLCFEFNNMIKIFHFNNLGNDIFDY